MCRDGAEEGPGGPQRGTGLSKGRVEQPLTRATWLQYVSVLTSQAATTRANPQSPFRLCLCPAASPTHLDSDPLQSASCQAAWLWPAAVVKMLCSSTLAFISLACSPEDSFGAGLREVWWIQRPRQEAVSAEASTKLNFSLLHR